MPKSPICKLKMLSLQGIYTQVHHGNFTYSKSIIIIPCICLFLKQIYFELPDHDVQNLFRKGSAFPAQLVVSNLKVNLVCVLPQDHFCNSMDENYGKLQQVA